MFRCLGFLPPLCFLQFCSLYTCLHAYVRSCLRTHRQQIQLHILKLVGLAACVALLHISLLCACLHANKQMHNLILLILLLHFDTLATPNLLLLLQLATLNLLQFNTLATLNLILLLQLDTETSRGPTTLIKAPPTKNPCCCECLICNKRKRKSLLTTLGMHFNGKDSRRLQ